MTRTARALALIISIAAAGLTATSGQSHDPPLWSGCCGVKPWGQRGGAASGQPVTGSSLLRNQAILLEGIPEPYAALRNPLPKTKATIERGAGVYARYCASCHGATGLGDGPAGRAMAHPPANLAWLSRMPVKLWDGFMAWTVAEGGGILHSDMPSFKQTLSDDDRWAVIAYIQARLPRRKAK